MALEASRSQSGFTLIEMITVTAVSTILILVLVSIIGSNFQTMNQEDTKTTILNNTRLAVERVARDVKAAKSMEANNSQPDANAPGAPGNLYSWTASTGSGATLVLAIPARDTSGNLIYQDGLHNNLYTNDVIYYLNSSNHQLFRRTITNQVAAGNAAVTTCPPASATAGCPADTEVVPDVANLTVTYYDSNNNVVASPSGTEAVKMTLTQTRSVGKLSYTSSFTTIVELRNK